MYIVSGARTVVRWRRAPLFPSPNALRRPAVVDASKSDVGTRDLLAATVLFGRPPRSMNVLPDRSPGGSWTLLVTGPSQQGLGQLHEVSSALPMAWSSCALTIVPRADIFGAPLPGPWDTSQAPNPHPIRQRPPKSKPAACLCFWVHDRAPAFGRVPSFSCACPSTRAAASNSGHQVDQLLLCTSQKDDDCASALALSTLQGIPPTTSHFESSSGKKPK